MIHPVNSWLAISLLFLFFRIVRGRHLAKSQIKNLKQLESKTFEFSLKFVLVLK